MPRAVAAPSARTVPSSDGELLARCADEPELFASFFARHHRRLLAYVMRQTSATAAEDIVAEAFVEAFTCRDRVPIERPDAYPWLVGIARNLVRHHHRHNAVRARHAHREAVIDLTDSALDDHWHAAADALAAKPALVGALSAVPEADRDTLLLHVWGDLSYAEIAEVLDIPIGTVRSRISRAKRQLRDRIGAERAALDSGAVFRGVLDELREVPPTPAQIRPETSARVWDQLVERLATSAPEDRTATNDQPDAEDDELARRRAARALGPAPTGPRAVPDRSRRVLLVAAAAVVALLLGAWLVVWRSAPDPGPIDVIDVPDIRPDPGPKIDVDAVRRQLDTTPGTLASAAPVRFRLFDQAPPIEELAPCWLDGSDVREWRLPEGWLIVEHGPQNMFQIADCPVAPGPTGITTLAGSFGSGEASPPRTFAVGDPAGDLWPILRDVDALQGATDTPGQARAAFDRLVALAADPPRAVDTPSGPALVLNVPAGTSTVQITVEADGVAYEVTVLRGGVPVGHRILLRSGWVADRGELPG